MLKRWLLFAISLVILFPVVLVFVVTSICDVLGATFTRIGDWLGDKTSESNWAEALWQYSNRFHEKYLDELDKKNVSNR